MLPKYKVHGESGIPVLFLGGMMQPHSLLGSFVDMAVVEGFQIIRIGYRGHHGCYGDDFDAKGRCENGFSLEDIANDAILVLDHLGLEKVDILGEALGGTIALQLASSYPQRFRSISVNGVIATKDKAVARMFYKWYEILVNYGVEKLVKGIMPELFSYEWAAKNPETIAEVSRQLVEERTREGMIALFQSTQKFKLSKEKIVSITAPVLVIASQNDTIVPPDHALYLHKMLPNSRLKEFSCGHAVSGECPAQLLETYKQFVWSLDKS